MESDPTRCAVCGQSSEEEITAERERCAKIAERAGIKYYPGEESRIAEEILEAIRSGK